MPEPQTHIELIGDQPALDEFFAELKDRDIIPLDTEFNRTSTFRPQLCLIQIAAASRIGCIDTLAKMPLSAMKTALSRPDALKLLHAAKQDLEALHLTYGLLPGPIFDTQIAAGLSGHPPQLGYAALVLDLLGIQLDKSATRTDWSRRPLSSEQLQYAAEDVAHLAELHERLRHRLEEQGRYGWAQEDSEALLDPALYETPPEQAWRRLAGIRYLPVDVQVRARQLAAWRERRASAVDRPRQWVMADKALLHISQANPEDRVTLGSTPGLPPAVARKQGAAILAQLEVANAQARRGEVDFERQKRPQSADKSAVKALGAILSRRAEELGIAAEILATRRDLISLLQGGRPTRLVTGWRWPVIGEDLVAALQ